MTQFSKDRFWKQILKYMIYPFMERHYPQTYQTLDLTFEPVFLNNELITSKYNLKLDLKISDKLVKLRTKDGQDQFIFLHLEIQAQKDDNMDFRMFDYNTKIRIALGTDKVLSAVLLLYDVPDDQPTCYQSKLEHTHIIFTYLNIKVADIPDASLKADPSDALSLFYLITKRFIKNGKDPDENKLAWTKDLLIEAKKRKIEKHKLRMVLYYIKEMSKFKEEQFGEALNEYINQNFKNVMKNDGYITYEDLFTEDEISRIRNEAREEWMKKGRKEGREEGREKGVSEATKKIALTMALKEIEMPLIEECTGLTSDEILDIVIENQKKNKS